MGRNNLDGLTDTSDEAPVAASPVWQARTKFAAASPCDRCPSDLSHFRARFADGATVWLCLDCATAAGLDVYQPAAPIAAAPRRRGVRRNALEPDVWEFPVHGYVEDWQEQGVRHLGHDTEEIADEIRYGVSW